MVLIWLALKFTSFYTNHGENITVPDFYGQKLTEIKNAESNRFFDFVVVDSVYDSQEEKGAVVLQNPVPGSKVKRNRKIYVTTVAKLPEKVSVPNLLYLTLRQAVNVLENHKLRAGRLIYIPSFDRNAVLEQLYKGDTIEPGKKVEKYSTIDLIVGSGKDNRAHVPFLIGRRFHDAIKLLKKSSLNIGDLYFPAEIEKEHLRVYRQKPVAMRKKAVHLGDSVSLWFKSDLTFNFDSLLLTIEKDTTRTDSLVGHGDKEFEF